MEEVSGAKSYTFVCPPFASPNSLDLHSPLGGYSRCFCLQPFHLFLVVHSRVRPEPQAMPTLVQQKRKPPSGRPGPSRFLSLSHPEWNPIFATRRTNILFGVENETCIENRGLQEDDVVRGFMKDGDESDACLPRADKVEQYCFGASLGALQAEKGDVGGPIAWLDERSCAGEKEQVRKYRGPLTARQLYEQLKRPVSWPKFQTCSLRSSSEPATSHSPNPAR